MRLPTWDGSANTQMIAKVLIVTIVFPVLVNVVLALAMFPIGFALTPLFARAGAWSSAIQKGFVTVMVALALMASFWACRRLWPREKDDDAQAKVV